MSFIQTIAAYVPSSARARGAEYFRKGRVNIIDFDGIYVEANVQGRRLYDVRFHLEKSVLQASCTCPLCMEQGEPCKHIWATCLAADQVGCFRNARIAALQTDTDDAGEFDAYNFSDDDRPLTSKKSSLPPSPDSLIHKTLRTLFRGKTRKPDWRNLLAMAQSSDHADWPEAPCVMRPIGDLLYVLDVAQTMEGGQIIFEVFSREKRQNGEWGQSKRFVLDSHNLAALTNADDRKIMAVFRGPDPFDWRKLRSAYRMAFSFSEAIFPLVAATGRFCLKRSGAADLLPLAWDDGPAWDFVIECRHELHQKQFVLKGVLCRAGERMDLSFPTWVCAGGWVLGPDRCARLHDNGMFSWISLLRKTPELAIPEKEAEALLQKLGEASSLPRLELPETLQVEQVRARLVPVLTVKPAQRANMADRLQADLAFTYAGHSILPRKPVNLYDAAQRRFVIRDVKAEADALALLTRVGVRILPYPRPGQLEYELAAKRLPFAVRTLTEAGWRVEADGKLYRAAGTFSLAVSSGIDWFEVRGKMDFDGQHASLPALLAALKRGEKTIRLGDGTFGILPEDWLAKYALLTGLGHVEADHLRFTRYQTGLLDALLAALPDVTFDAAFERARAELRRFETITPSVAPASFVGQLRDYQREGLGWLQFLRQFGFGGCLADDMGLGKTIQVLALLDARRALRSGEADGGLVEPSASRPSLVVVPRSLVFNWNEEAAQFTPRLRVLDYSGADRARHREYFDDYDLILTTYGTLRRDITHLADVWFDYVILDEAQNIKNARSDSCKAARLLRGAHRLALSGTPIENHLGELWSLLEFLNPGMLSAGSMFQVKGGAGRNPDDATRQCLARGLRPFILRRTKAQVAKDLPERTEETIHCELDKEQRRLYDQLRNHVRHTLMDQVNRDGLDKSKIHVLEALLRLRQAACHPGLIDPARTTDSSAKLEALLPQIAEVMDEGHKVLVFSQFTRFLAIVQQRLDKDQTVYEYLDGQTQNRQKCVHRFQNDPDCKLFLISLKAGGLGLNLTAAEYVFILDPWWNPAVEMQAIDRAHRIGQTRPVFAYRLIAKGTVEEKVLELQRTKRSLADAIITSENSLIRDLTRADLELLLG